MISIQFDRDLVIEKKSLRDRSGKIRSRFSFSNRSPIAKINSLPDQKTVTNQNPQAEHKIAARFFSGNRSPFFKIKSGSENSFQIDQRFFRQKRSANFRKKSQSGFGSRSKSLIHRIRFLVQTSAIRNCHNPPVVRVMEPPPLSLRSPNITPGSSFPPVSEQ